MAREINIPQVLEFLHRAFEKASEPFGPRFKAVKGTALYEYQCDFAYCIDEIERCPYYMQPKAIQAANDLLKRMEEDAASQRAA
jgi:hypothetical protein